MKFIQFCILLGLVLTACQTEPDPNLASGSWHAYLRVMDEYKLPFTFDLVRNGDSVVWTIHNAEEQIAVDEITLIKDSFFIQMPVFECYLAGRFTDSTMSGSYVKESLDRVVPFYAEAGQQDRFTIQNTSIADVSGVWETYFNPDTDDPDMAKGIFEQQGKRVTGTFRTPIGDYRYLEGVMDGDSLKLSTFDGAHAFLFVAEVTDSTMQGAFYSGNHSKEFFTAKRNEDFKLPDPNVLTYLKEGYDRIEFMFPDELGNLISLGDPQFQNKAVLIQIMGTWCPNCLDESRFISNYISKNNYKDLAVVALAFEYAKTEEKAFEGIRRLKERLGINYPVLLAQVGTSSKSKANEKLPMLNHVLSYPTTIYLDKQGVVRNIHTGFNGPATGAPYEEFKREFDSVVQVLRSE